MVNLTGPMREKQGVKTHLSAHLLKIFQLNKRFHMLN